MSKIETEAGNSRDGPALGCVDPGAEPHGVIRSAVLMGGRREVTILHAGERYRLRVTANDKLILTK